MSGARYLELDTNGNILVSSQHTDLVLRYDVATGSLIDQFPSLDVLSDFTSHTVKITYTQGTFPTPGTLAVFVDDMVDPVLTVDVDISETLDLDHGSAWVGFTAATGGGWQNHDILNWSFTSSAEGQPTIAVGNDQAVETDSLQPTLEFPVTVVRPDTVGTLDFSIDYATQDGIAVSGSDYQQKNGQLHFTLAENENTQTLMIPVTVFGDDAVEPDESLFVSLGDAADVLTVDRRGEGTIINDDTSIAIDDVVVVEGDPSPAYLGEFINAGSGGLYQPRGMAIGVDGDVFVAARDPASVLRFDGETGDYLGVFADVSIAGEDQRAGEVIFGPGGDLYVSTGNNNSVLRFHGQTGAFLGEFVPPGLDGLGQAWGMAFGPDGDLYVGSGLTEEVLRYHPPAVVGDPAEFVEVFASGNGLLNPWDVAFGTDGHLYVASSGTDEVLRFQGPNSLDMPGAFIDPFIPARTGGLDGPRGLTFNDDGYLYVVSQVTNQVLRYNASTGAFVDAYASSGLASPIAAVFGSDGNLLVSSRDAHNVTRFGPASHASFTVSLTEPSSLLVTVRYDTDDGMAETGSDYVTTGGTLTFEPGQTSKRVFVPVLDDNTFEPTESFIVTLSNPTGDATFVDAKRCMHDPR